jgi:hemolysin activation/secretion protein/opacity protein-like surface antigen
LSNLYGKYSSSSWRVGVTTVVAVVAGAVPLALAQERLVNPTVLAPAAKPPQARVVSSVVTRGRAGLQAPPGAEKKFVTVRRVSIANAFPELAEANAAFVSKTEGRRLSLAEIYQDAAELQVAYARAFPLAALFAPQPDFRDGEVCLEVRDGVIEDIRITGVSEQTQALARERLAPLVGKRRLTAADYQRHVLLVSTLAGVSGQITTEPGAAPDGYVLSGALEETRIVNSSVVTNRLPLELGTWEFANAFAVNNALGLGEQVAGSVSSSTDFDRYFSGSAKSEAYSTDIGVPVGSDGLTVSAGFLSARWRPSPYFSTLGVDFIDMGERFNGRYDRVYARLSYPLILTTTMTLRAQAFVEHIDNRYRYSPFPLGFTGLGAPVFDTAQDRYGAVRLVGEGSYQLPVLENARVSGLVAYGHGLGGRQESLDFIYGPPLSKIGASPNFNRLNVKARLDVGLPEQFIFSAIGRMQTSFGRPLMLPESFILDGQEAVSGYASGTLNVDRGVTARAELARPFAFEFLDYNRAVAPYVFASWGSGVRENIPSGLNRHLWAETFGGGVRAETAFVGSPFGESLALEFGRDISNIPFRQTGYRTNVAYNLRFAGDPFAAAIAPAVTKGPAPDANPVLWQGFYAGLSAGYTWDPRPSIVTSGAPLLGGVDAILDNVPAPPFWYAAALGAGGGAPRSGGGFIGGGQAGLNFQSGRVVAGVEADLQGANARVREGFSKTAGALLGFDSVSSSVTHTKTADWLGTARGRLGYLVTPTLLGYATAGLAYGQTRASSYIAQNWDVGGLVGPLLQSSGSAGSASWLRAGWTIGAGPEWIFAPNASLKAEWLHYDLGNARYGLSPLSTVLRVADATNVSAMSAQTQFRGDIVRLGLNYHFGRAALEAAATPPAVFASGFYGGLNAGYGWDSARSVVSRAGLTLDTLDRQLPDLFGAAPPLSLGPASTAVASGVARLSAKGAFGGGQGGYNFVHDRFLAGAEADMQGAAMSGRGGYTAAASFTLGEDVLGGTAVSTSVEKTIDWFGTLRARGLSRHPVARRLRDGRPRLWRRRPRQSGRASHRRISLLSILRRRRAFLGDAHRLVGRRRPRMEVRARDEPEGRISVSRSRTGAGEEHDRGRRLSLRHQRRPPALRQCGERHRESALRRPDRPDRRQLQLQSGRPAADAEMKGKRRGPGSAALDFFFARLVRATSSRGRDLLKTRRRGRGFRRSGSPPRCGCAPEVCA